MVQFIISTTPFIQDATVKEYLGVVVANDVLGVNVISDTIASFSDFFGGGSGEYRSKLNILKNNVLFDLQKQAISKGANALIGVSINFNEVSGKGKQMFMASATGTAVRICDKNNESVPSSENANLIDGDLVNYEIQKERILSNLNPNTTEDEWNLLFMKPALKRQVK